MDSFWLLVPSRCGEGLALLSLVTLLRLPAVPYGAGPALPAVPALGCSTKARSKKLRLLFVPSASQRLRQPGACRAPSPRLWRAFSPPCSRPQSPPAPVGGLRPVSLRPSRRLSSTQNLRRSLVRNWRPVCSGWGLRSLGPSLPLSPPSAFCLRRGWAGPQPASSSLDLLGPFVLRTANSVFRPVNFLSLFCCPTV